MNRFVRRPPAWIPHFRLAASGIAWAVRTQRNFSIHLAAAAAVVVAASLLSASLAEWCLLGPCIAAVLVAELFNTALEHLARAITDRENDDVRHALDIASGAVLMAALGAAAVGGAILVHRVGEALAG